MGFSPIYLGDTLLNSLFGADDLLLAIEDLNLALGSLIPAVGVPVFLSYALNSLRHGDWSAPQDYDWRIVGVVSFALHVYLIIMNLECARMSLFKSIALSDFMIVVGASCIFCIFAGAIVMQKLAARWGEGRTRGDEEAGLEEKDEDN